MVPPLPQPLSILDNGKEFLRLTTLADVRDFLKHMPKQRRQFKPPENASDLTILMTSDFSGKPLQPVAYLQPSKSFLMS